MRRGAAAPVVNGLECTGGKWLLGRSPILSALLVLFQLVAGWSQFAAAKDAKHILVLFSADPSLPAIQEATRGLFSVFHESDPAVPRLYIEHMDALRFPGRDHEAEL